jgi:hypothetical protein
MAGLRVTQGVEETGKRTCIAISGPIRVWSPRYVRAATELVALDWSGRPTRFAGLGATIAVLLRGSLPVVVHLRPSQARQPRCISFEAKSTAALSAVPLVFVGSREGISSDAAADHVHRRVADDGRADSSARLRKRRQFDRVTVRTTLSENRSITPNGFACSASNPDGPEQRAPNGTAAPTYR